MVPKYHWQITSPLKSSPIFNSRAPLDVGMPAIRNVFSQLEIVHIHDYSMTITLETIQNVQTMEMVKHYSPKTIPHYPSLSHNYSRYKQLSHDHNRILDKSQRNHSASAILGVQDTLPMIATPRRNSGTLW